MIKLSTDKLANAIKTAKQLHPKVVFEGERRFKLVSPRSGNTYSIKFEKRGSERYGECNCKAGQRGIACYHLASAALVNVMVQSMRTAKNESPRPSRYVPTAIINNRYEGIDI